MECLFLLFSVLQCEKYLQTHFIKVQQENKELKLVGDGGKQSMPAMAQLTFLLPSPESSSALPPS